MTDSLQIKQFMNNTDEIVKNLIKNRFHALIKGNYQKPALELLKVTREMGFYDLADELEGVVAK